MSDDGYKIQASIKFGAAQIGMLNVRANDGDEFRVNLSEATGAVGDLAVLTEALNTEFAAVSTVAAAFPGSQVINNSGQSRPAGGGAEMCQHGAMVWKSGADWKGWFCPAQKNDPTKCKARYDRS